MNIGFIGTGKISSAVIESICTSNLEDYQIYLSPRNRERSLHLEGKFERVSRCNSNQAVLDNSDIIFLALRPPIYKEVVSQINFREDHQIISLIPFSFYSDLKELIRPAHILSRATPLPTVTTHTCPIPVYKPNDEINSLLQHVGQPFEVHSEEELHTIWTITCLISPYYDMLQSLSEWASHNSVSEEIANKYVADMFHTLSYAAHKSNSPNFSELSHHAATPGGLNERTAKAIMDSGAHETYVKSAGQILDLFKNNIKS